MPYPMFDRSQLNLLPLEERIHDVQLGKVLAKRVLAHETDGALAEYAKLLDI